MARNDGRPTASGFSFLSGALLVLVGSGVILVATLTSRGSAVPDIHPFVPPTRPPSLPAFGSIGAFESLGSLDRWLAELAVALVYTLCLIFYYLGLLVILAGASLFVRAARRSQERSLPGLARMLVRERWFPPVVGLFLFVWLAMVFPLLLRVTVEVAVVLLVGGMVFVLTAGLTWVAHARASPAWRVVLVYPMAVVAVVLPPIAAGLVSPTFGALLRTASTAIAKGLLDTVLAVGGLNDLVRRTFDLQGVAYVGMWLGLGVVLGWLVGLAVLLGRRVRAERAVRT